MADSKNEEYYSPTLLINIFAWRTYLSANQQAELKLEVQHVLQSNCEALEQGQSSHEKADKPRQMSWASSDEVVQVDFTTLRRLCPIQKPATIGDDEGNSINTTTVSKDKYCEAILQHLNRANLAIKKFIYMARGHNLPRIKRSKKILQNMQHLKYEADEDKEGDGGDKDVQQSISYFIMMLNESLNKTLWTCNYSTAFCIL